MSFGSVKNSKYQACYGEKLLSCLIPLNFKISYSWQEFGVIGK